MRHADKGIVTPFGSNEATPHFWLYTLETTSTVPVQATEIIANQPYFISMPNHEDYADKYCLNGTITFEAINTSIPETAPISVTSNSNTLTACFQRTEASDEIFVINRLEEWNGRQEGSIFAPGLRDAMPFEAYYTTQATSTRGFIPLFFDNDATGITTINLAEESHSFYNLQGQRVKNVGKGIYIHNGKKIQTK